jgi:hypothetical protein
MNLGGGAVFLKIKTGFGEASIFIDLIQIVTKTKQA